MKLRSFFWLPAVFAAVVVVGGFISASEPYIPPEFTEARAKSALLGQSIVELSRTTLTRIDEIAELDRTHRPAEALLILSSELLEINNIREKGAQLASQLERMAQALPDIHPEEARTPATEAVTAGVALVTRLMTHNAYLAELFDVLHEKFTNRERNLDGRVNDLVNEINNQAKAINQFNKRANKALQEFDAFFPQ